MSRNRQELIESILANPTYLPESGLVRELSVALDRLSTIALGQLEVIIGCKVGKAVAIATDCETHVWRPDGGSPENPGYADNDNGTVIYSERCGLCGLKRYRAVSDGRTIRKWCYELGT